jgi:RimJ/RimL family protein N-acetyltransferase
MTDVPVIETEQLRLRPHYVTDLAHCTIMWADPAVVRYTIGTPSSPQRTWQRMMAYRGHWAMLGFGYWAVEERSTGEYVGELGFADFKRNLEPAIDGMPELGWALMSHVHGKGYATEGLRAAVAWGDARFGGAATVCLIHSSNTASFRVAEKIGFSELLRRTEGDHFEVILSRTPALA